MAFLTFVPFLNESDFVKSSGLTNRLVDSLFTFLWWVNLSFTLYVPSLFSSPFLISALIVSMLQ